MQQLTTNRLLRGLQEEHLALITKAGKAIEVGQDETVIFENRPNEHIYLVISGTMHVVLPHGTEDTGLPLATLGDGDYFGEYSFVDSLPPNTRVVAAAPSALLRLHHRDLNALMQSHAEIGQVIYHNLLVDLVGRLRSSNAELNLFLT
jgi:CRP-like cAMP-binding protein